MLRFLACMSVLSLCLTIASCETSASGAGGAPSEQRICRYSSTVAYRPLQILRFTQIHGGRTCAHAGRTMLYVPTNESSCKDFPQISFINGELMGLEEGTAEYLGCFAVTGVSGAANVPSLSYVIDENATEEMRFEFATLYLDMLALVSNDGLQVEHIGKSGRIICMEAAKPSDVLSHMQSAGLVTLPYVRTEFSEERCAAVSQRVQNRQWPIVSSMYDQ